MKVWKKLSAVTLALVMALALCVPAFATTFPTASDSTGLTNGEAGGYTEDKKDTPNLNTKVVNIQKEITAYNPDETIIYGPEITYTYTVTPAANTELTATVTDAPEDHESGRSVVATPLAGVTTGVKVNTGDAGSATSAVGTLVWTNADILKADSVTNHGAQNLKNVLIDFSAVVFEKPGVYRYKITETVDSSSVTTNTYDAAGVTDSSSNNVRYLDVYVMRSATFAPLASEGGDSDKTAYTANDWMIYGYVCIPDVSTAITSETATKTNGFVNSVADGDSNADQYHTYNLTVKKVLSKDTDAMKNHQFPFTVTFSHETALGKFQLIAKKSDTAKVSGATEAEIKSTALDGTTAIPTNSLLKIGTSAPLESFNVSDIKIADQNSIKFIGLPNGTKAVVTEKNDVLGTTYSASATEKVGTGAATEVELSTTGGTLSSNSKTASIDTNDTATYTQTTTPTVDSAVEIVFTNVLALVSPTGVTLRYAPYLAMLGAGVVALPLTLRKKEEEF